MTDNPPPLRPAPAGGEAVTQRTAKKAARKKPVAKKAGANSRAASATVKPRPAKRGAPAGDGAALVERVTRAIERELTQIEIIVGGERVSPARRTEADRRARTLASLARTLAEMTRLRTAQRAGKTSDDEDAVPRDLDEFRATLERRLEQMVAARQEGSDRRNEPG